MPSTPSQLGDHNYFSYLVVDDADAYLQEITARQIDRISNNADKPWGMREFGIRTPDGFRIMIGHTLD